MDDREQEGFDSLLKGSIVPIDFDNIRIGDKIVVVPYIHYGNPKPIDLTIAKKGPKYLRAESPYNDVMINQQGIAYRGTQRDYTFGTCYHSIEEYHAICQMRKLREKVFSFFHFPAGPSKITDEQIGKIADILDIPRSE